MTFDEGNAVSNCTFCNGALNQYRCLRGTEADGINQVLCYDCNQQDTITNFKKDDYLDTGLMLTASMTGHEVKMGYKVPDHSVRELATLLQIYLFGIWLNEQGLYFEKEFWTPAHRKQREKVGGGMSGKLNGVKVFSFATAGRCLITLEHRGVSVTFITADGAETGKMGWQDVNGTRKDIRALLEKALSSAVPLKMTKDKKVRIAGT